MTTVLDPNNQLTSLRTDMYGNVNVAGTIAQQAPDYDSPAKFLAAYDNFSGVQAGDFVTLTKTSNGQQIIALSGSPFTTGESTVVLDTPVRQPCALEVEASVIRNRQQFAAAALFANGPVMGADTVPAPVNITSIYQSTADYGAAYNATSGAILTVALETALPEWPATGAVFLSDWVNITGAGIVDNRLLYQNLCIKWISGDRKTFTAGFGDEGALPSYAITATPTLGTAKVNFYNNMAGAHDGAGMRFTGNSHTSAAYMTMFGNGDAAISGSLVGDHRVTSGSTAPVFISGRDGSVEIKATSRFRIEVTPDDVTFLDRVVDNAASAYVVRTTRTAVKPDLNAELRPRFRLYRPPAMTRPIADIVSVAKTGTTTATVVTGQAHGLVTGNFVNIKGVRDQTNFAATTTGTTVTVVNATTFTCVIGAAVTATSYGGSVVIFNGSIDQPGIVGQSILTAQNVPGDQIQLVSGSTWAGLNVGDYIDLYGARVDLTGVATGLDGVWEVSNVSTTTLQVKPVTDIFGVRVTPATPALSGTVNCGGTVILRTTLRSHDLQLTTWSDQRVKVDGAGTLRIDKALPVSLMSTMAAVPATQGTPASISSTTGLGGWYIHPAVAGLADIASTAITTSATSAAIANHHGNGFQVNITVSAVSGTTPTMDVRVEESYDGGTNWVTLYEFQRITANGSYNSPILRASGRHIRYVRTVAGTTPSFTNAVIRNILPFIPAEPQKRIIDRSIVLTTLNSVTPTLFQGAANNVQLVINIGAATTPPALQIEGSEDGANWYAIGTPLTAVASSTVEVTVTKSATYVRARVSTAGVIVTAGYVALKAWS